VVTYLHLHYFKSTGTDPSTTLKVTELTDDIFKAMQSLSPNCNLNGTPIIVIFFALVLNFEIGTHLLNLPLNYFDL